MSGEQKKKAALDRHDGRRAALIRRARRKMVELLLVEGATTVDAVRASVPIPPGVNPSCMGAVPRELVADGIIRQAGYVKAEREERHAAVAVLWALANRHAALGWLAASPELPDDDDDDAPPDTIAEQGSFL